MEQLIECWAKQEENAEPERGIEIQDQDGEAHEVDAERQLGPAFEEIGPEDEEGPERHREAEEQENNVIIIREEGRVNAAIQDEHNQERLQGGHLEQEDTGCVL